jgi:methyltransferase (TIGR00027 family)
LSVRNITDTALWVAVYRADESDRPDAVFKDPFARLLAGERGEAIVQAMMEGRKNSWSFVARTYLFDILLLEAINNGVQQVINLAAGLDTRPYRLKLPSALRWIDVDLPDIIDYMNHAMRSVTPVCSVERIALDLSSREARREVFNSLASRKLRTLVLAEGLVGYLTDHEVGSLSYDLSHSENFDYFLLDLMSPGILPMINAEMGSLLEDAEVPLIFAPEEGEDFFRLFGWTPVVSHSKFKTAARLHRLPSSLQQYADQPEPEGPKGDFPWSGVCLFKSAVRPSH